MMAKTNMPDAGLLEPAFQVMGDTLKTGVKIQEEIARWWSDMLPQIGQVQEWQKKSKALVDEAIPAAQKNIESWMRLMEQNYRRGMEMLQKAFEADGSREAQAKAQEIWEASVQVVRDSATAMAQTNMRMMSLWAEVVRKNLPAMEAAARR